MKNNLETIHLNVDIDDEMKVKVVSEKYFDSYIFFFLPCIKYELS